MIDFKDLWANLRFENPEILKGLWALPLVLLLLLVRRRAVVVTVPWLPLWDRAVSAKRRDFQFLRQMLSILLKILALAFVIVALANPYREHGEPPRRETAVFLDTSPGVTSRVGANSLWDGIVARANEVRAVAARDGSVRFIAWEEGMASITAPEAAIVGRGLRDTTMLARFVRASPSVRCVVVTPFDVSVGLPDSVLVASSHNGALPEIGGIRAVAHDAQGLTVDVDSRSARELVIESDGEVRARVSVSGTGQVRLPIPSGTGQSPRLRLVPSDAWPDDDVAELVLPPEALVAVLVVAEGKTPYLDAALAASGKLDAAKSHRVTSIGEVGSAGAHDLTLFVGVPLPERLPAGTIVAFGSRPAASAPVEVVGSPGRNAARVAMPGVAWLAGLDPAEWVAIRALMFRTTGTADVLVTGEAGPLVVRYLHGGQPVTAFAVTPDISASSLPRLAAFPVMLRGLLGEASPRTRPTAVLCNQVSGWIAMTDDVARSMVDARGVAVAIGPSSTGGGYVLPSKPGRYVAGGDDFALAWLFAPGGPSAKPARDSEWPTEPEGRARESLLSPLLILIAGILLLDAIFGDLLPAP